MRKRTETIAERLGSFSIVSKIVIFTIGIVITAIGITTYLCLSQLKQEMVHLATVSQESRIKTFWELLNQKGPVRLVDNRLMAGDYVLNNNFELPDKIKELCGGTATIFMNDERITTNVMKADGTRAVGTKLQGAAYDAIFKQGKPYRGVAMILGVPYFTAYDPIRDLDGKIIGVLYVGVKTEEFLQGFNHLSFIITAVALGLVLLFSIASFFAARTLITPIRTAMVITEAVAQGDLTITIPIVKNDEAGRLLASLRIMVDGLAMLAGRIINSAETIQGISGRVAGEADRVVHAAKLQHGRLEETSSSVTEIAEAAKGVGEEAERLSQAAADTSSSILEMAASVEEVALNAEKLATLVAEITASITQSASSAAEIGESARVLVDASTATASSIAQMEVSIRNVKEDAAQTAQISSNVAQDALKGQTSMADMGQGMSDIRASSTITAEVIDNLSARTGEIGAISSVIDEIASQTALLALNAAIIAAQAGEHGKGFAVVAEEIKTLAGRTARSTGEIAELIKGVQKESGRAVRAIRESEQKIAVGEQLCTRSAEALEQIVSGIDRAGSHVEGIARATVELAQGTRLIREAMDMVSEMTERIGISTREQASAGKVIMVAAEKMRDLTSQFRNSTREQSKVGNSISKATEDVTHMAKKIDIACAEQANGSRYIASSVSDISNSADESLQAATHLDQAARDLSAQIDILHQSVAAFRLAKD